MTKKTSVMFKLKWNDLPIRDGDLWKIDTFKIGRIPMLLFVHTQTMYTFIRKKKDFKNLDQIKNEILDYFPEYEINPDLEFVGRDQNRSLNGSITDIKRMLSYTDDFESIEEMESFMNETPFSYLGMSNPNKELGKYLKSKM